ncbi:MAG: PGF-CTERM sorting domain-containing protein [Halobacteriaceae archaeon]
MTDSVRAVSLAALVLLSAAVGLVGLTGSAAAATNVSISPADDSPGATTTYTAEANVELSNQDTLQYVDLHYGPADVGNVSASDVTVYIDGSQYTDGFSQFSAGGGTIEFKLANSRSVSDGDPIRIVAQDVVNPDDDFTAEVTLHDTGDAQWQSFSDTVAVTASSDGSTGDTTAPSISEFALTTTASDDLQVYFESSERLADVALDLSGAETRTLTEGAFDERSVSDGYTYAATLDVVAGEYTATLRTAADAAGNDGASGQSDGASVPFPPVAVTNGTADPVTVSTGATINNQQVTVEVVNLSADGDTDTMFAAFPNALADSLSVNGVSVANASVAQSPELVDGFDGDGVTDTVRFQTDTDDGGAINATVAVDVSVHYPATEATYPIDFRVVDSAGSEATATAVANVTAQDRPAVESFAASVSNGGALNLSLVTTEPLTAITVRVAGPENASLTRADFTANNTTNGAYYTASLDTVPPGTYRFTLLNATDDEGLDGAANQTATATVLGTGSAAAHVSAAPRIVGAGSATHTVVTRVTEDSVLAGRTLTGVTVAYSEAYRDADGSVTSVSDDQNVVTLRVVGPGGVQKAALGGTDAIDVNVVNGAVRLDLSDVDSDRSPTLAAGDRVVVGLRPATNPAEAGTYTVNVSLHGPNGATDEASATLTVTDEDAVVQRESQQVTLSSSPATLEFSSGALVAVSVDPATPHAGWITVHHLAEPSTPLESIGGQVVSVVDVFTPAPTGVTVGVTVDAERISADRLTLAHHGADGWTAVNTAPVDESDGTVTISASLDQASTFAVLARQSDATATATATSTTAETDTATATQTATPTEMAAATPTETESNGSGGVPGFTVGVTLAALVAAAVLRLRR